nr:hypothetical protein [Tanacetum cinerariifolium]
GANNDLNVLNNSPLFSDLLDNIALVVPFEENGVILEKGYYLADGIYPEWTTFVESFTVARDEKNVVFKRGQEGARKEVERAFNVFQGQKRSAVYAKIKHDKKLEKKKIAKAREAAENRALELGEELFVGNDADEFSSILNSERPPKVLITTCRFNSTRGPALIKDLLTIIPNADYYKRGTYDLKKIVDYANNKEYTSIVVVHTSRREPDALLIFGLPNGPTAHFKLSNLVLHKDLK